MRQVVNFLVLFLMALSLTILTSHRLPGWSQDADSPKLEHIPKNIQTCLPQPPVDVTSPYQFQLLAKQDVGAKTFHLLQVIDTSDPNDYPWETLIVVAEDTCKNLIPLRSEIKTLTRFVSQDVANQMALARYQELLKTPAGKRLIQRQLKVITVAPGAPTDVDLDEYILAPEDAWALQQLDIAIPANFKTHPVETPANEP